MKHFLLSSAACLGLLTACGDGSRVIGEGLEGLAGTGSGIGAGGADNPSSAGSAGTGEPGGGDNGGTGGAFGSGGSGDSDGGSAGSGAGGSGGFAGSSDPGSGGSGGVITDAGAPNADTCEDRTPGAACGCWTDAMCGQGARCYGVDCAGNIPGQCHAVPPAGSCLDSRDCVAAASCDGAWLPPSCSSPESPVFGTCVP